MKNAPGKLPKRRLSPEESRAKALAAACALLIEQGPQAVTLKAVAARIGQTHSNLLHHFGSVAALHQDLTLYLAENLLQKLMAAIQDRQSGKGSVRDTVDTLFDVFDSGGGAKLCAWLLLSGNTEFFSRFSHVFSGLVDAGAPGQKSSFERRSVALKFALLGLGDALMGKVFTEVLSLPRDEARNHAEAIFSRLVAEETGLSPKPEG